MPLRVPENTLAGFALALAEGADGIELDVHCTADGVVVVHHDATLADGAAIATLTLDELGAHESSPSRRIPTLLEVCALVKGRAELFVELKGEGIEHHVAALLFSYDGPRAVHSFDHAMIRRLAALQRGLRLGILVEDAAMSVTEVTDAMRSAGALDLWPHYPLVTERMVEEAHAIGGRVLPWTVNDPVDGARFAGLGVDGICTDDITAFPPRATHR